MATWWYDLKTRSAVQDDEGRQDRRPARSLRLPRGGGAGAGKVAERNEAFDEDPRWKDD